MTTYIACGECVRGFRDPPAGEFSMIVHGKTKSPEELPADHGITFQAAGMPAQFFPADGLICDLCNKLLEEGTESYAVTLGTKQDLAPSESFDDAWWKPLITPIKVTINVAEKLGD